MTNIIRIALLFPLLLAATQYDVWQPGPVPSNAILRATYPAGDWGVVNVATNAWTVTKPVPCHPTAAATIPDCDTFIVNDPATWNSTGFWARRLPK